MNENDSKFEEQVRRSIRSTAGNRYQTLLASEDTEKDEFYESHYGGFTDIKSDDSFRSGNYFKN